MKMLVMENEAQVSEIASKRICKYLFAYLQGSQNANNGKFDTEL